MSNSIIYKGQKYILESKLSPELEYSPYDVTLEEVLGDHRYEVKVDDSRLDKQILTDFGLSESSNIIIVEGVKKIHGLDIVLASVMIEDNGELEYDLNLTVGNKRVSLPNEYDSVGIFGKYIDNILTLIDRFNMEDAIINLVK